MQDYRAALRSEAATEPLFAPSLSTEAASRGVDSEANDSGVATGGIVGIALAGLVLLLIVAALLALLARKRRRAPEDADKTRPFEAIPADVRLPTSRLLCRISPTNSVTAARLHLLA